MWEFLFLWKSVVYKIIFYVKQKFTDFTLSETCRL